MSICFRGLAARAGDDTGVVLMGDALEAIAPLAVTAVTSGETCQLAQ